MQHDLSGQAAFNLPSPPSSSSRIAGSSGSAKLVLPDTVTLGITRGIGPNWTVSAEVQWTDWSQFKMLNVFRSNGTPLGSTPTFDMRQDAFVDLPWDRLLANFDAISSCAYSVSVLTKWSGPKVGSIWLKTRLEAPSVGELPIAHLGLTPGPAFTAAVEGDDPEARLNPFDGVPGPWSERLAHFRPDAIPGAEEQIQSEYMIARPKLAEAVAAIRSVAARIDRLLLITEIRTMAADRAWLSPAYGRNTVGIHFTWVKQPEAVHAITRELEVLLLPLGARPHWGKLIHADAASLAPLYARFSEFRACARHYDPLGKFRNAYLERHVFG